MRVHELDYEHPEDACAQRPLEQRSASRLLVSSPGLPLRDDRVANLPVHVVPGDVFVLNDTRVQPARIDGVKESGGRAELLVLERRPGAPETWLAMIRASHAPKAGRVLDLPGGCRVRVAARDGDLFVLEPVAGDLATTLRDHGRPPLPPYIRREADAADVSRYQTAFAREDGAWTTAAASVAAPTAGLHFDAPLLDRMEAAGAVIVKLSLGVGPGTFRPIEADAVEDHRMHEEAIEIPPDVAEAVNAALRRGARITAVGTTSLRALESAATSEGRVRALRARTGLYCLPGCRFRVVSRLMTNFHRPRSTLLALVAAFAGTGRALEIHREGVRRGYRLFSYGDATLVERPAA